MSSNLIWTVNENARSRIAAMKYSEIFKGEPPHFETTYGRGQFSRTNLQKSALNDSQNNKPPNKKVTDNGKKKILDTKAKNSPQSSKNAPSKSKSMKKGVASDNESDDAGKSNLNLSKKIKKILAKKSKFFYFQKKMKKNYLMNN